MAVAFAGMKADSGEDDCRTFAQAEASAEIPFGAMVAQGSADNKAILPADANAKFVGVVVHSHEYVPTLEMGTTGLKPKVPMAVMIKGRIWVYTEETVALTDSVYVRHTAGAGGSQKGLFRKSADTATAVLVRGVRWISSRTGAGLVQVQVDMPIFYGVAGLT